MLLLCDAGPLVALINQRDTNHSRCAGVLTQFSVVLLTTGPCLTEAMYLVGQYGGWPAQEQLWSLFDEGLKLHTSSDEEWERICALMQQYRDVPMVLADASLVALAESLKLTRIFTLDRHFFAYRIWGTHSFDVLL